MEEPITCPLCKEELAACACKPDVLTAQLSISLAPEEESFILRASKPHGGVQRFTRSLILETLREREKFDALRAAKARNPSTQIVDGKKVERWILGGG